MSLYESIDFAPTLFADYHSSDLGDSFSDSYFDPLPHLDQSICSDYTCCGQKIPDLHRLLEHFEEVHVLPLPSDSRPLYSSPVYAHPRSSSAQASYILSYPQPDPPLQVLSQDSALPEYEFTRISPAPDLTHSPLSSAASSCNSSPVLGEPLCLPPALFSVQNARPRTPPPRALPGASRTAKHHHSAAARVDPLARTRPVARTPERPTGIHRRKDGREKAYKCPHPGCTKSYLNPNGLKYHLEKGTCTNADARRAAPAPVDVDVVPATDSDSPEACLDGREWTRATSATPSV